MELGCIYVKYPAEGRRGHAYLLVYANINACVMRRNSFLSAPRFARRYARLRVPAIFRTHAHAQIIFYQIGNSRVVTFISTYRSAEMTVKNCVLCRCRSIGPVEE